MHKQRVLMYRQVEVAITRLLHPLKNYDTVEKAQLWGHGDVEQNLNREQPVILSKASPSVFDHSHDSFLQT